MAKTAWRTAKYVKSLLNVEKKIHEVSSTTSPSSTGYVTALTDIGQGDTINLRDGNSIKLTYMGLRATLTANASAPITYVRCIVFRDNQQEPDTVPAIGSLLESASVNSFLAQASLGRFSVLMDKVYSLNNNGPTQTRYIESNFKLNNHVRYNGSSSVDIQKGGYYILWLSNLATLTPGLSWNTRVRFIDN